MKPPTSAYVAAGKVFFADGKGVIRSLSPSGEVREVTRFPTSSLQMLSFAVSQDGSKLLASVLTVPPKTSDGIHCSHSGRRYYKSDFRLDLFSAMAGSTNQLLYSKRLLEGASHYPCSLELAGWDRLSPYGADPSCLGPGGGPGHYPGVIARFDPVSGRSLGLVYDPVSCSVDDIAADADFVCIEPGSSTDVIVRQPDGSEVWRFVAQPDVEYSYAFLSPDELHVLVNGFNAEVLGRDGTEIKLPASGYFFGWLDSSSVIGSDTAGTFSYVSLNTPATMISLGFEGGFVGTLTG